MISIDTYCETTRRTGKNRYAAVSFQPNGGWPSCMTELDYPNLLHSLGEEI